MEFIHTPWVHWPETMCTYLKEAQILFSCDFFGSHWSSKAIERITELIPNLKAEILPPVLCRGYPRKNDFRALDALADTIARKHQNPDYRP